VGSLKVNRAQFNYDKEIVDPITGETVQYFSHWKRLTRQLLQLPFALIVLAILGTLISFVFAIEIFISEMYNGPFKFYLVSGLYPTKTEYLLIFFQEYLPTVLLGISLPFISSRFENIAAWLTQFENYRTEDRHEMALTQKVFVVSSITKYLPILLTAFVYVPFGDAIVGYFDSVLDLVNISLSGIANTSGFSVDASRLRNEVIALVVTEQLLGFGEELILPVCISLTQST